MKYGQGEDREKKYRPYRKGLARHRQPCRE